MAMEMTNMNSTRFSEASGSSCTQMQDGATLLPDEQGQAPVHPPHQPEGVPRTAVMFCVTCIQNRGKEMHEEYTQPTNR
jgi:hypothetical protein